MTENDTIQATKREVEQALPEIQEIEDTDIREKVIAVWAEGLVESGYESVDDLKFGSGLVQDETQVDHIREVTQLAIAMIDTLVDFRDIDVDRDTVIAGALLHDISKFVETAPDVKKWTEFAELIPHPHYAVHMLESAGISTHIQHIALTHTHRSKPQPATIEAQIVKLADIASAESIYWDNKGDLLFEVQTESIPE